jgi:uncharacterized Zn-binding protein involved in type VI secretion
MQIARELDTVTGVCYGHAIPRPVTGIIVASQSRVFCDSRRVALVGDDVRFDCGHTGIITVGTRKVYCQGRKVAQVTNPVIGKDASITATIVTGSTKTIEV